MSSPYDDDKAIAWTPPAKKKKSKRPPVDSAGPVSPATARKLRACVEEALAASKRGNPMLCREILRHLSDMLGQFAGDPPAERAAREASTLSADEVFALRWPDTGRTDGR